MVLPRKIGVRLDPPAIILVYDVWGKIRMRTMPVRNVWEKTSTSFILEDIKSRHDVLKSVPDSSLIKMIEVLKRVKKGDSLEDALQSQKKEDKKETTPNLTKDKTFERSSSQDEDTDFEIDDDLPLDDLSDDFWNLKPAIISEGTKF